MVLIPIIVIFTSVFGFTVCLAIGKILSKTFQKLYPNALFTSIIIYILIGVIYSIYLEVKLNYGLINPIAILTWPTFLMDDLFGIFDAFRP